MPAKITQEQFIANARAKHNNFYDYSKVQYKGTHKKVIITCPVHGDFSQTPANHCHGQRCRFCGDEVKKQKLSKTHEQFIKECNKIHENYYGYSKTVYKGVLEDITITCPVHGDFEQNAHDHNIGKGCSKCGTNSAAQKQKYSKEKIIELSKKIHGDTYVYSKVKDVQTTADEITILCRTHGAFKTAAISHYNLGTGCPDCGGQCQTFAYIHLVLDNDTPVAIKYGIETYKGTRFKQQNKKSKLTVQPMLSFKFNTSNDCRNAEKECKKLVKRALSKAELPDGYTESTFICSINAIIDVYKKHGGVKQ